MADVKIRNLPAANSISSGDLFEIETSGGTSQKANLELVVDYVEAAVTPAAAAAALAAAESANTSAIAAANSAASALTSSNTAVSAASAANTSAGLAAASAIAAEADADRAEAASDVRVSIAYKTYTELAAITGTAGQTGAVFDDAGTHTDPVVGGTVDNEGIYRYSVSPAGWERLAPLSAAGAVSWGDITGKPTEFTPSAHIHATSEVTGLDTALSNKLNSSAVSAYGLTLIDDADAAAARTTLELGTAAVANTTAFANTTHTHSANDITSGILEIVVGGTGANTLVGLPVTGVNEGDFAITDGASVVLNPNDGGTQRWTLGANRTATMSGSWVNGQSMTLMVDDGAVRTLTLTGVNWIGGAAPTLETTGWNIITLWKSNGTVRASFAGSVT